jgi:hypothetical protein
LRFVSWASSNAISACLKIDNAILCASMLFA